MEQYCVRAVEQGLCKCCGDRLEQCCVRGVDQEQGTLCGAGLWSRCRAVE